jgi:hypothetical protein
VGASSSSMLKEDKDYSLFFPPFRPHISFSLGLITTRSVPFLCALPFFLRLPPSPSRRNGKPRLKSCSLEPNLTVIRERPTERKTSLEIISIR